MRVNPSAVVLSSLLVAAAANAQPAPAGGTPAPAPAPAPGDGSAGPASAPDLASVKPEDMPTAVRLRRLEQKTQEDEDQP